MTFIARRSLLLAVLVLAVSGWLNVPLAWANMTKNVEAVRPRLGQVGTTVEVSIQGISLGEPRAIVFYRPGIQAVELEVGPEPKRRGFAHGGVVAEQILCKFVIADDCPLGEHVFRVLTATELTCIGTFHVTPFPVIDEEEPNNGYLNETTETASRVPWNVTLRGHLGNGSRPDRDLYRLTGRAGQQLTAEIESVRIADQHYGDSEFDLAVAVFDAEGRKLIANDDNPLTQQDPQVSLRLPADGDYFVEVRRSIFVPSETIYALHVGEYRRPLAAFPAGGPSGTTQQIRWLGDPSGEFSTEVAIPAASGTFQEFVAGPDGRPSPVPLKLRSSPFPNVLEVESQPFTVVDNLPVALNGIIDRPDDVDAFRLTMKHGTRWSIRVLSSALGAPIDPMIRLRRVTEQGELGDTVVELDDSPVEAHEIYGTSFRGGGGLPEVIDPAVVWEPPADGVYQLEIWDTSGAGRSTGVYRVEIQPLPTLVQTVLHSATFDWTESTRVTGLAVPRGNRWTVDLSLPSGPWQSPQGEFVLTAPELPRGVRLICPPLKAGQTRWPVQLVADEDADVGGAVISLQARSVEGNQEILTRSQQNVPFINHSGGSAWRTVRTERFVMGVTDPAPFTIDLEPPTVALVRGGELNLTVRVTRQAGFTGAVEFRCGGLPRSISTPPPTLIEPGETTATLTLGAEPSAALEAVPLYVIGSTVRDDISEYLGAGHVRVTSEVVPLMVSQPYVELTAEPASIRRGERKPFVWQVRHHLPFEGAAPLKLLGLPKGVAVVEPLPTLSQEAQTVSFVLEATEEALLGQATGLSCEVGIPTAGQRIVQRTGKGLLRIDPAAVAMP